MWHWARDAATRRGWARGRAWARRVALAKLGDEREAAARARAGWRDARLGELRARVARALFVAAAGRCARATPAPRAFATWRVVAARASAAEALAALRAEHVSASEAQARAHHEATEALIAEKAGALADALSLIHI